MKIYAPKRFPDGTIRYGEIADLSEMVTVEKSHFSPKEIYLPIVQTTLYFKGSECIPSETESEEILIYARACDIEGIKRLDTIFLRNGEPDNYYKRLRDKVRFELIPCTESFENCFCASMDVPDAPECKKSVKLPEKPCFDSDYWSKYDEACIGCGGCNAVCPTCSCFDTIDVIYNETSPDGERRRVWGSCMREDFSAMAGGHNVRKTAGERMRFKVMHKVFDFKQRFDETHMCVGCGRCVDRCPKELSIIDAINNIAETEVSK